MKTYTLKVIDKELKTVQATTQIEAMDRNTALKIARVEKK